MDGGAARMHETAKPSAQTVLKPCPCCGGEAAYRERDVRSNAGFTWRAGRIVCLDCGLSTMERPADGSFGLDLTREDFAEAWNRRVGDGKVDVFGEHRADR